MCLFATAEISWDYSRCSSCHLLEPWANKWLLCQLLRISLSDQTSPTWALFGLVSCHVFGFLFIILQHSVPMKVPTSPPLAGSSYFISINHFVACGVWPNFSMATDLHLILPCWVSSAPLPHAGAAVPKVSAPKRFKLFHITVFTFFSIIFTWGTEKWEHNSPTSEVFRAMLARGWKYPPEKSLILLKKVHDSHFKAQTELFKLGNHWFQQGCANWANTHGMSAEFLQEAASCSQEITFTKELRWKMMQFSTICNWLRESLGREMRKCKNTGAAWNLLLFIQG